MESTNTFNTLFKTSLVGFMSEACDLIHDLRWMILLAFILIVADLWFGIEDSQKHKVEIRRSRMWRNTINKALDYLCYIVLGTVLGKALGEPYGLNPVVVSVTIMVMCYCFEIDSIYTHICSIHGIEKKYSIWSILWKLLTLRFKALDEAFKSVKNNENEKTA